jgi:phospholipase C
MIMRNTAPTVGLIAAWLLMSITALPAMAQTPGTPIRHVIVIFQENISFDHYFATYPIARNDPGEPAFHAAPDTPSVNGLTPPLIERNPNKAKPFRLPRRLAATCGMNHEYRPEQQAYDGGLLDKFVEFLSPPADGQNCPPAAVMGYFDGNTVTALWNYAQHFALADNFFGATFGPSSVGAINLVSGNTHGATPANLTVHGDPVTVDGTMIADPNPQFDDCADPKRGLVAFSGRNLGDLLNDRGVTWGWFQGGFRPTGSDNGKAVCAARSTNIAGKSVEDYVPHHEPFEYYRQTANPHHLPPSAVAMIGKTDQANHQYDLADFEAALAQGYLPEVSFLKAKAAQDGHAGLGHSNPLDEQVFLATAINAIEKSAYWPDSAIVIAYDDSDGWYDHVMPPILNGSVVADIDALGAPGRCGNPRAGAYPARCGYGPRLPLLLISPYAKVNFVYHGLASQTAILRFIEDNWNLGRIGNQSFDELGGSIEPMFDFAHAAAEPIVLDPRTGEIVN